MRPAGRTFLVFVLLVLWLAPVPAAAQASGPVYIVQAGDTLWGIALMFGLDAAQLADANSMTLSDPLVVGRELVVPGFEGISGVLTTRPVDFGETVRSLSLRHGLTQETVIRLNRVVNPGRLFVGQDVIFPQGEGDGLLIPESATRQVEEGETDLELSMRTGFSSWALRAINARTSRMWSVPGEQLSVPAPGRPSTGLDLQVESVSVHPLPARQGRTSEIEVRMQGADAPQGSLGEWTLGFHALEPGQWVALQGVYALADPGMIDLHLSLGGVARPPGAGVRPTGLPGEWRLRLRSDSECPRRDDRSGEDPARGRASGGAGGSIHARAPVGRPVPLPGGVHREFPVALRLPPQLQRDRVQLLPRRAGFLRRDRDGDHRTGSRAGGLCRCSHRARQHDDHRPWLGCLYGLSPPIGDQGLTRRSRRGRVRSSAWSVPPAVSPDRTCTGKSGWEAYRSIRWSGLRRRYP